MPTGRISFQDSIYQVNISNRKTIHGKIEYGEYLTHLKGYSSPDIIFSISSSEMNKDTISFQAINTNIESWRNIVINGQLIKE